MNLMVLSNYRPNSGWDTYTQNLASALGDKAEFLYMFGSSPNKSQFARVFREDSSQLKELYGRIFPKQYFKPLIKEIDYRRKEGLTLHYSYNLLPFIGNNLNDIVTIHDVIFMGPYADDGFFKSFYSKHLLRHYMAFNNIITVSKHTKKQLQHLGCKAEIEVIYPPCPDSFFRVSDKFQARRVLGLPLDKIIVLSPSNDKPWKNLNNVFRTLKTLGEKYLLVRVGPSIGIGKTFSNVDSHTMNLLYNSADVLLFPSLEEGFGYPLVEALKTGLPAVVSDIEVFHEVGGNAVVYVDPTKVESILEGVKIALNQSEKMSANGIRRSEKFTQAEFIKNLSAYYSNVLGT